MSRAQRLVEALHRLREEQLVAELPPSGLMPRVLDLAREVVGARYGVLAMLSDDGRLQPTVLVADGDEVQAVSEPRGYAELGATAAHAQPRVEPTGADGTSESGYLAAPIFSRGRLIGCLYLADRSSGVFTDQDLQLVAWAAEDAGSLLRQAQLAELARTRLEWLQAGTRVTQALLDPNGDVDALQLVTDALHRLAQADLVMIWTPAGDLSWMEVATVCLPQVPAGEARLKTLRYQLDASSLALATMRSGRAVRVEDMGAMQHPMAARIGEVVDVGPLLVAPLSADAPQGNIVLGRLRGRPYFSAQDQEMAELFATHAAVARQTVQARADRSRLLVLEDRERVGRQLNDSVIQRLFAVGLTLQSLQRDLDEDVRARLGEAVAEINQITRNVRHTIFSFEGHESTVPGLRRAVESTIRPLATSLGLQPVITGTGPEDLLVPGMIVANVLAVVYQIVRNAGRFTSVDVLAVEISLVDDEVVVAVREQGLPADTGGYPGEHELIWRAEEFGGSCEVTPVERGSVVTWAVPVPPGQAPGADLGSGPGREDHFHPARSSGL